MPLLTESTDLRDQIALFRYGLIADLLHRDPGDRGLYAQLREKAARTYTIPGTRRSRIAAETLRDWLQAWRKGGFEALRPRGRRDTGQPRAIPADVADILCTIKDDHPAFTVAMVIAAARERRRYGEPPDTV